MTECVSAYAAMRPYARDRSAVSSAADGIRNACDQVMVSAERSQALFGDKADAIAQLISMARDHQVPNWDGYGAKPIHLLAVRIADAFVRALPRGISMPEFAAEPDGSVSLDWMPSPNRIFSLSVNTSYRLAYAWLDGSDRGHAVARFDGDQIPPGILSGIRGITNGGSPSIRLG